MDYRKNLLSEMRAAVISDSEMTVDESRLLKAVTVNENLSAYGYRLNPDSMAILASSSSLDTFMDEFMPLVSDVKASPMYPDYPSQVMEMDEAKFRFNQLVHYFSTYGIEKLLPVEVKRGWLPDEEGHEKVKSDDTLLPMKTMTLIREGEMYSYPFRKILSKKERMTLPELEIVTEALTHLSPEEMRGAEVPFKENLIELFRHIMLSDISRENKIDCLCSVLKHTGDVWKCLEYYIGKYRKYSLSTSEKKTAVRLLESFPADDFRANLVISKKRSERIITLLEFLSYSRFSRSAEHMQAVNDLRDSKIRSWNSYVREMIENRDSGVVKFVAKRPGMLLRMITELLKNGFSAGEILNCLEQKADSLSTVTIVRTLTHFGRLCGYEPIADTVYMILKRVLQRKLEGLDLPVRNRKVFIDEGMVSLEYSQMSASEEGGYLRAGMALKIPEEVRFVRFFTYWNDEKRIDIDLHAHATQKSGERVHIGWNAYFRDGALVSSGDITHSDAAEYIDIRMDSEVSFVDFLIHSYTGVPFSSIETLYAGLMAVRDVGVDVKLYDPKNCLFTHDLRGDEKVVSYGFVDLEKRIVMLTLMPRRSAYDGNIYEKQRRYGLFTMKTYLEMLLASQNAKRVDNEEEADIIMRVEKANSEEEISLCDENFFMDM